MLTYWVYKDRSGYFRWQLIHRNGNIIADSGEGYVNRADCINGISLCASSNGAPIRDR
jgi:uncharacterized protein